MREFASEKISFWQLIPTTVNEVLLIGKEETIMNSAAEASQL